MIEYREFKVRNILEKYIFSIIMVSSEQINKKLTIYPDSCDYLIFSSSGYHGMIKKSKKPQDIHIDNENLILIRLKPYTLYFLENSHENYFEKINELHNLIFSTKSIVKVMAIVNHILFEEIDDKFSKQITIEKEIVDLIIKRKGDILVSEIEEAFTKNIRTIQRRFNKIIELTPKEFIDIIRFQSEVVKINFLKSKKHTMYPEWFSDYSHYYKFFSKFSDKSPRDFFSGSSNRLNSIYDIF